MARTIVSVTEDEDGKYAVVDCFGKVSGGHTVEGAIEEVKDQLAQWALSDVHPGDEDS